MYKVEILGCENPSDRMEKEAIVRRRRQGQERNERIFNPKVDIDALDEQVRMKSTIASIEKKRSEALDTKSTLHDNILTLMDEKLEKSRRHQREELNQFRATHQQKHNRRDYDLYDPAHLRKELPTRIGDFDPRSGVSSLQKFQGEDLEYLNRDSYQKQQMKSWVKEQIDEKEQMKEKLSNEKSQYDHFQSMINRKMNTLQSAVDQAKRDQAKCDSDYNAYGEKKSREMQHKQHDTALSTDEIISNVNGIFLTEQPDVFNIKDGHKYVSINNRVRVDLFKGFTAQHLHQIRQDQHHQRLDNIAVLAEKARQEKEWAARDTANRQTIEFLEQERSRKTKEVAVAIRKENEASAIQYKERNAFLNKVLTTNRPQEGYFTQFNSTSR